MVYSKTSWRKILKIYLEIKFYNCLVYVVFIASGYMIFDYHECIQIILSTVFGIGENYAETFLVLYLLIPFINCLIEHINLKQYALLLGILLCIYTIIPTFSLYISVLRAWNDTWNYIGWMICVYLIGAFIRKYGQLFTGRLSVRAWGLLSATSVALIFVYIALYDFYLVKHDIGTAYWFVNDANKLLALTTALLLFVWFEKIHIKRSRVINGIAATTFGVFLIHANCDAMRTLIWNDIVDCVRHYNCVYLPLYAFMAVIAVFTVCAVIDRLRMVYIEGPIFKLIDMKWNL